MVGPGGTADGEQAGGAPAESLQARIAGLLDCYIDPARIQPIWVSSHCCVEQACLGIQTFK